MSIDLSSDINNLLTSGLNPEQYAAVTHQSGPLLIVAGAGSGKTRVITARIAYLIQQGNCDPRHILALTFTNKAAQEMKERIEKLLGNQMPHLPFIGTFHSYCLRFLKTHNALLAHPFLTILDEDDQITLLQKIIARNSLQKKITPKHIAYQISHLKNRSLNPSQDLLEQFNPMLQEIYKAYEYAKRFSKCLDFDDLLLETVQLFRKNPSIQQEYQNMLRHILVDEYQDTNVIQHELLKSLALDQQNALALDSLCAVGDEDQSIYSWRGATIENIMHFKHDFPNTTIIKIEQNYRSVQPILETANQVISHNKNRNPKSLWSSKPGLDRIRIFTCLSEYQEADIIVHYLKAIQNDKHPLQSTAILYRAHFQSRALEEALIKHAIPYKIIGGIQFYERKEIKDILAYVRLLANPYDRASFFRIINCPLRGLGAKFEEDFSLFWNKEPLITFSQAISHFIQQEKITDVKRQALEQFIALFNGMATTDTPSYITQHLLDKTHYFTYLKNTYELQEAQERIDNIKELIEAMLHAEQQKPTTINTFLDDVALMQTQMNTENSNHDQVILMTLHAAKGLEFPTVIIIGLEEGLLPSMRSLNDDHALEEERRLLYVGITRAQERLIISYTRYRYSYGSMTDQRSSRFLSEIPESLACRLDCSYLTAHQIQNHLYDWLGIASKSEFSRIVTFNSAKIKEKNLSNTAAWKKNQPVAHDTFGLGIIQDIELKANQKTYLTIQFKAGLKKIAAEFVKIV